MNMNKNRKNLKQKSGLPSSGPSLQNIKTKNENLNKEFEDIARMKRKESKNCIAYANMLCDPAHHLTRAPSLAPIRGATRHFSRTFTLNSSGANSEFGIKLSPEIDDFYEVAGGVVAEPVNGLLIKTIQGNYAPNFYFNDATTGKCLGRQQVSPKGFTAYWDTPTVGALTQINLGNSSPTSRLVTMTCIHTGGESSYVISLLPFSGTDVQATVIPAVGESWLGIKFTPQIPDSNISMYLKDSGAVGFETNSLIRPLVEEAWMDVGSVERLRISAMSILASYRGNLLENAGVIAACRAPSNWTPDSESLYQSICKLPEDRYKGPILEGAYTWWLPQDTDELDYRFRGPQAEATSLYLGGEFVDPGGSLEVTIDVVVDFYSPLQIFEREHYPSYSDAYFNVLKDLSELPAATCNPKHLDILVKGGKKLVKKGLDFAKSNPALVAELLAALASAVA